MPDEIPEDEIPKEHEVGITHQTTCEHEWAVTDQDPNSDMISYACVSCWSGMSLNPNEVELINGKMKEKQ